LLSVGKPTRVDPAFIKTLGYKSSYDEKFLTAIKFIGLVEDKRGGGPTERWTKMRADMGYALKQGLMEGYSELFEFYPDAHLRDDEVLANFFRGNSDGDGEAITRMVTAFTSVRDLAKFDLEETGNLGPLPNEQTSAIGDAERVIKDPSIDIAKNRVGSGVNLNIQLQLPSDATGEVYDKFFEAMKKHGLI
jgi:hypothetical protein